MALFKKKKPVNEINLKTPIWRIVITVFISMLLLSGYFIIVSRINALIYVVSTSSMQMEAQGKQAMLSIDKNGLANFLMKYDAYSPNATKDSFYIRTTRILTGIKLLDAYETENAHSAKHGTMYRIRLVGIDTAKKDCYVIASNDSADAYGQWLHLRTMVNTKDTTVAVSNNFNIHIEGSHIDTAKSDLSGYSALVKSPLNKVLGKITINPAIESFKTQILSSIKGGIKVSLAVFFITFIIIFFSLRKVLKRENKIKATLHESKLLIEEKSKAINDSIAYAHLIQQAILPSTALIYQTLQESFILYKPKDLVSGDFYAFAEKDAQVILAAVDCTGHGVPGAFMSVIGHNLLTEIIVERSITKPFEILAELNKAVRKVLKQDENQTKDGMDAIVCRFDLSNMQLQYAGANRPLWMISPPLTSPKGGRVSSDLRILENIDSVHTPPPKGEVGRGLLEIKATKCSIGGHTDGNQVFENHEIALRKGDSIYLFSDGFADQFGGPKGKKLMTKQFKEILLSLHSLDMHTQQIALEKAFEQWKGSNEQVDDVLVIGVRV